MDVREWLDRATRGVRDAERAAEVRLELAAHVQALFTDLIDRGMAPEKAREEALHRMGDAAAVARTLAIATAPRSPAQRWVLALGALLFGLSGLASLWISLRSASFGAAVAWLPMAVALAAGPVLAFGAAAGEVPGHPWLGLAAWAQSHRRPFILWALLGVLLALGPARYLSPALGQIPSWPWWNVPSYAVLGIGVLACMRRSPDLGSTLALCAAALWPFYIAGIVAGHVVLALSPTPSAGFGSSPSVWVMFLAWFTAGAPSGIATLVTLGVLAFSAIQAALGVVARAAVRALARG